MCDQQYEAHFTRAQEGESMCDERVSRIPRLQDRELDATFIILYTAAAILAIIENTVTRDPLRS